MKEKELTADIPVVWNESMENWIPDRMRLEAAKAFRLNALPDDLSSWKAYREKLKQRLCEAIRLSVDHSLPLNVQETGIIRRKGYRIRKLFFQAAEHRYVTANLYVPDGPGPFPAVLNLHGHHQNGRLAEKVQARGHILALNRYVCLSVDAFGSGERSTVHCRFEPHGGLRGGLLENIGEPLIGIQAADNMRAVDLLCSLPFADPRRIGATGASGGGNQTLYLAALDERVRAAVSAVSVGTFESYIMGSNCICETIFDGMNLCEESSVIALIAPRAYKILSALQDEYPTFSVKEMLRTYHNARPVFQACGADENLSYQTFMTPHGYHPEMMESMLGFFDLHLKGIGSGAPRTIPAFIPMTQEEAQVFPEGSRPAEVTGIPAYVSARSRNIRNHAGTPEQILEAFKQCVRYQEPRIGKFCALGKKREWMRFSIEDESSALTPMLVRESRNGVWRILASAYGKQELKDTFLLSDALASGDGLLLFDPYAAGERGREYGDPTKWDYHNTARSCFWLGHTLFGEWVKDYIRMEKGARKYFHAQKIHFGGNRDCAPAALLAAGISTRIEQVYLENSQCSFNWSGSTPNDTFLSVALSIPGILLCGDIADLAALSGTKISFHSPRNPDGTILSPPEESSFASLCHEKAKLFGKSLQLVFSTDKPDHARS